MTSTDAARLILTLRLVLAVKLADAGELGDEAALRVRHPNRDWRRTRNPGDPAAPARWAAEGSGNGHGGVR